ncbi:HBL267Wp [Eremothecium sinecaudum]|uniref:HBL267Wp n=1 Tax=Eremothecium sinecaudum TaxID=45286 RepID=A0A109UW55_9SACH|nr:HBL267Wp [Eremothecium sinecaudum]AMD18635.1 HBL267Wp [Eremothecium sinecaudum]
MKFGKHLLSRQLELPEYNGHFINYKALKKLLKQLSVPVASEDRVSSSQEDDVSMGNKTPSLPSYQVLQSNKVSFFFRLERELEKVNEYYMEKEADIKIKFEILQTRYQDYLKKGRLSSKQVSSYRQIRDGIKKFERDLSHLEQFIELNRTGFSKVLKKWDKRSHSHTKDFYLLTVVSVQPVFAHNELSKWNDEILSMLLELEEVSNDDSKSVFDTSTSSIVKPRNYHIDPSTEFDLVTTPTFVPTHLKDNSSIESSFASVSHLADLELEVEGWYMEVLHVSKLNDQNLKQQLIKSFVETKVQSFVANKIHQEGIDKDLISKELLTKIFSLLVTSSIDDESLQYFFTCGKARIDLTQCKDDDLVFSRRNVFHEAASCQSQSRVFILNEALQQYHNSIIPEHTLRKLLNAQDVHARTPLHYACELGKTDFATLLIQSWMLDSVDIPDTDSKTPLVLSIIKNHVDITRLLLVDAKVNPNPEANESNKLQFSPLNVACAHENFQAAKMILECGNIDLQNVQDCQGLCPLHVVAKNGGNENLIKLLITYGADPNGVDNFNKWTPIFHAIQEGHSDTVRLLLNHGANWDVVDEDNLSPLFYALWEGNLSVLNILLEWSKKSSTQKRISSVSPKIPELKISFNDCLSSDSLGDIPDFELPPPIIPLRKYGHNFLEQKIFVKIVFQPGKESIKINKEDEIVLSEPGRVTLTSNFSDIIPRNVLLPLQDYEDRVIMFQVDKLEGFSIDFEVFPTFGTRLIAKTNAMSSIFREVNNQHYNDGHVILPLFDSRLKYVGTLELCYQVIFPYNGKPLEIAKYDTYWKSTTSREQGPIRQPFVTSSSLSGKFVNVMVTILSDGKVIAAPDKVIAISENVNLFLNDIRSEQLESLCKMKLDDIPKIQTVDQLKQLLRNRYMDLDTLLAQTDPNIKMDIHVYFPTPAEISTIPVNVSPLVNVNKFVDNLLLITFCHMRYLNHNNMHTRSIVFSSCNALLCSILNWKQPNYPVIYRMNGLKKEDGVFVEETSNHLKHLAADPSAVSFTDYCSRSIREVVNFAANNNLLGICIPLELLKITPKIIERIKQCGLLLIGSQLPDDDRESFEFLDSDISAINTVSELEFRALSK